MLLMLIALILLASSGFKRSHIAVIVHHPMLWAVVLWSAGHLVANGTAADLLLFGAFLVWSVADLAAATPETSGTASFIPSRELAATVGAIVAGLVVYALLHRRPAPLAVWRVAAGDVRRSRDSPRAERVAQAKH